MGSNLNNAALISADDFFNTEAYEGDIYKTANLQDRILSNYCHDETQLAQEQKRISKEMADFQDRVYGRDSVAMAKAAAEKAAADSIAAANVKEKKTTTRRTSTTGRRQASTTVKTKTSKPKSAKSSGSSKNAGLSVRRQRH